MVLGGTGVRVFGVLLAGFALFQGVPYFRQYPGFWTWLLVSYLFTLALEMALLLVGRTSEVREEAAGRQETTTPPAGTNR